MDNEISINLYKRVFLPEVVATEVVRFPMVYALNMELASLGYSLSSALMRRLARTTPKSFAKVRNDLLQTTMKISGVSSNHQTLFKNFPYDTPDHRDYLVKRVLGYFQNQFRLNPNDFTVLSCGHIVDNVLFDTSEFGACPICQSQTDEQTYDAAESEKYAFEQKTPLTILDYASPTWAKKQGSTLLARNSSLSVQERAFLLDVAPLGLKKPDAVYRENLPFVFTMFDGDVGGLVKSATDVMRIAAFLSNKDADLSLKDNVKFKVKTSDKKKLLRLLDNTGNLEEDMLRNRERWIRLGEVLNPGTDKNARKYPNVAKAFATLRNSPRQIKTFGRVVEKNLRAFNVDKATLTLVASRPGEFIRRFDHMMRNSDSPQRVLDALKSVLPNVTTRMLFDFRKYLMDRMNPSAERSFIPKGMANKLQIVTDNRRPISVVDLVAAIKLVEKALIKRFKPLPKMGKVFIDPRLSGVLLPFNRRGDSASTVNVIKGSRYVLEDSPVIRLFVHWTGNIDVDLSVVYFDAKMNQTGYVSYSHLKDKNAEIVHSGDIVNAPNGASEFIDMRIDSLRSRGIRYVLSTVISYRGDGFDSFPCYAGYMGRDSITSGKHFEPATVRMKFDLNAKTNSYMPLLFDLETREMIFADLVTGGGRYGAVHHQGDKFKTMMNSVISMPMRKPTVEDVLTAHATARGKLVLDRDKADVVFDADIDVDAVLKDYVDIDV